MKAEPSRLIPRKPATNLELLIDIKFVDFRLTLLALVTTQRSRLIYIQKVVQNFYLT